MSGSEREREGAGQRFSPRFRRGFLAAFCVLALVELALVAADPQSWSFAAVLQLAALPLLGGLVAGGALWGFLELMRRPPRVPTGELGKRRWTIGRVMALVGLAAIDMAVLRAAIAGQHGPDSIAGALMITIPAWNQAAFLLIRPPRSGPVKRARLAARRGFLMGLIGSWAILFVCLLTANRQVGEVFLQFVKLTLGDPARINYLASSSPWIGIPMIIGITFGFFYLPLLIAGLVCAAMARRLSSITSFPGPDAGSPVAGRQAIALGERERSG